MAEETKVEVTEETKAEPNVELTELQKQIAEYEKQVKNLKATLSERNSEAANHRREAEDWKSKYESTLSEAEQAAIRQKELEEAKDKQLNELLRKSNIADYKAKYLSMGYSEELAQSSAEAKVDGNEDIVFQNEAKFIQMTTEKTKAEILKSQPSITSGKPIGAEEVQKIRDEKLRKYFGL